MSERDEWCSYPTGDCVVETDQAAMVERLRAVARAVDGPLSRACFETSTGRFVFFDDGQAPTAAEWEAIRDAFAALQSGDPGLRE